MKTNTPPTPQPVAVGHTPGPWTVSRTATDRFEIDSIGYGIAQIHFDPKDAPEMQANARLIAAAPELLAALKDLLATYGDDTSPTWIAAQDAVKKAEGKA